MEIIKAIILGIIEGLTEFLPVSSTGHLIITAELLDFKGAFATMFEVIIQLGAILAVVAFYRKRIFSSVLALKPGQWGFNLWAKVIVAMLPFGIMGVLFKDSIEEHLFSPITVGIALLVGAGLMLLTEHLREKKPSAIKTMDDITFKQAAIIGLFQCMALFPGMSRSASTIIGGFVIGASLTAAAEFSFFLAIPVMFGATFISLLHGIGIMNFYDWSVLAIGFVVAFVSAYIVIGMFLAFLNKHAMRPFAYYRIVLGVVVLLYFGLR